MKKTISEILKTIDYINSNCNEGVVVETITSLDNIEKTTNAITWCNNKNIELLKTLNTSNVIIVGEAAVSSLNSSFNVIVVDNPRRTFQEVLSKHFVKKTKSKVCKSAIIDSPLGKNPSIGNNVVIEENCQIGDNVSILHNSVILSDTIIGDNVTIGSNNTIGGIGFGYEKNENGFFELIPHVGNVVICNNVDIGNNTCIDRAVLGSTYIGNNVKIDNLVHIAHGVEIGENSVVIANSMIAGSVKVGENVWIAPSSSVLNKLNIGKNSLVGLGSVVIRDVDSNNIVAGSPAKFIRKI